MKKTRESEQSNDPNEKQIETQCNNHMIIDKGKVVSGSVLSGLKHRKG